MGALTGMVVLTMAPNVPGPVAVWRLAGFGATVIKIEPPNGDGLARSAPKWYGTLHEGAEIIRTDLKSEAGQAEMQRRLAGADLLVTSSRPSALGRLGLGWEALHARYPRLCQVAIVGHGAPDQELPGHDLTYLAAAGVLGPPEMPRTLMADLLGAERAASAGLALLLERERTGAVGYVEVALADGAEVLAQPLRHGLTRPGAGLGGGFAGYRMYQTAEGWVALGALEQHFRQKLFAELDCPQGDVATMEARMLVRTATEWEEWGKERDLPIVALRGGGL